MAADDDRGKLSLTAVLKTANGNSSVAGVKTYKLAFIYPRGYLATLDEYLGMQADIYWNDVLVAHSAHIAGMHQHPQPKSDPVYIVDLIADPADTALANLADEILESGELRLFVTQLSLMGPV